MFRAKFEEHGINIIENIHASNPEEVGLILLKCIPEFGKLTLLAIAFNGDSTKFIAHRVTQRVLNKVWWGRISKKSQSTADNKAGYVASLICPLLAPNMMKFDGDYTNFQQIACFYHAPKTVYYYNVIFCVLHNLLFATFLVTNTCKAPSILEIVLIG